VAHHAIYVTEFQLDSLHHTLFVLVVASYVCGYSITTL